MALYQYQSSQYKKWWTYVQISQLGNYVDSKKWWTYVQISPLGRWILENMMEICGHGYYMKLH